MTKTTEALYKINILLHQIAAAVEMAGIPMGWVSGKTDDIEKIIKDIEEQTVER